MEPQCETQISRRFFKQFKLLMETDKTVIFHYQGLRSTYQIIVACFCAVLTATKLGHLAIRNTQTQTDQPTILGAISEIELAPFNSTKERVITTKSTTPDTLIPLMRLGLQAQELLARRSLIIQMV